MQYLDVSFGLLGDLESYFNEEFKTEDIENEQIYIVSQPLLIPTQRLFCGFGH